ncbi:MAG: hypothetical protein ACFFB2_17555 [Promethearchaeota archaeon]
MRKKIFFLLIIIFSYPYSFSCITQRNAQGSTFYTQENVKGPNSLKWHENLKLDTILGWQLTEYFLNGTPFSIAKIMIKEFDVVQIGFVRDPPSSAREFFALDALAFNYKPPIWLNLFIDSMWIDLDLIEFNLEIGKNDELSFLQLFILPIEYIFKNGSSLSLDYFLDVFGTVIFNFQDYSVSSENSFFIVEWGVGKGINYTTYSYTISQTTGVTTRFSWNTSDFRMIWNFCDEASNFDLNGRFDLLADRYSVRLSYPVTTPIEFVILIFLFLIPISLLVLKISLDKLEKLIIHEQSITTSDPHRIHYLMKKSRFPYHKNLNKPRKNNKSS